MHTLSAAHFNITAALEVSKTKILSESNTKVVSFVTTFYSTLVQIILHDTLSHHPTYCVSAYF